MIFSLYVNQTKTFSVLNLCNCNLKSELSNERTYKLKIRQIVMKFQENLLWKFPKLYQQLSTVVTGPF